MSRNLPRPPSVVNVAQSSHHTAYLTTRPHKLSTNTKPPRAATMLGRTMRTRLASLASKPFLYSRVFSTAPIIREGINVRSFFNSLNNGQRPEIVTAEGLRNVAEFSKAQAKARAEASLSKRRMLTTATCSSRRKSSPKGQFSRTTPGRLR